MIKIDKIFLGGLLISNMLFADDLNIDNLLTNIEKKSDLSEKTKLENGGVSYIYTREDLIKMQAHNLKDVLKSTYPFGYSENRYNFPDPYAISSNAPFMSSSIRIYIDDQEITNGFYGSGIITYGDIDINFVDHIEVYSGNPTFEYSSEPAFTIIKLYSRVAQKDEGSKIGARVGSRGSNEFYAYDTQELDNGWSYFSYISGKNLKRKKYNNSDSTLSRDTDARHFFGSFYNDNNKILIDGIKQQKDMFMGPSAFATPQTTTGDIDFIHIGYNGYKDNLSYLATYDRYDGVIKFQDKNSNIIKQLNNSPYILQALPYMLRGKFKSDTYTIGLKYKINLENSNLLVGSKYRYKYFKPDIILNNTQTPNSPHDTQTIASAFAEYQYNIADNKIATLGVSQMAVRNNASPQDDNLLSYRAGYTYTNKKLISKTIYSHLEMTLDPYMVGSDMLVNPTQKVPITKQNLFLQNIKYNQDKNRYEIVGSYIISQNQLMPDPTKNGKLAAYSDDLKISSFLGRYTKEYRVYDKIEFDLGVNYVEGLPIPFNNLFQYSAIIRSFNTLGKFDLFNELLYYMDSYKKRDVYDYSAGIIYHKTDDLSFSIKGVNIFDKAKKSEYRFVTPTMEQQSLSVSSIDRAVIFSMEYTF